MRARDRPAGDIDDERHGRSYAVLRQPDPRIAAGVHAALGTAVTVLNVGAGAGSYEPADRYVLAVEPSVAPSAQRPVTAAPALDDTAERLPIDDDTLSSVPGAPSTQHCGAVATAVRPPVLALLRSQQQRIVAAGTPINLLPTQ